MGGNYQKDMYRQLMELWEKVESLESGQKKDKQEIQGLRSEVKYLRKENAALREKVEVLTKENTALRAENTHLRKENALLRDDNERMKRILSNNSSNSSLPPSTDQNRKAANTYNGRKKEGKKPGGQKGHKGNTLTKADVEAKILEGKFEHRVEEIGTPSHRYISRYRIDLEFRPVATELRIYADADGKFSIPPGFCSDVTYGESVKAFCAYLYSEGVVSVERISECVRSLSDGALSLSGGSVYSFLSAFSKGCEREAAEIQNSLQNAPTLCTDATVVTVDGKNSYIRNFSDKNSVLYCPMDSKSLKALEKLPLLTGFAGILEHDHETALYRFGTGHGECNVHIGRYLEKNSQETGNRWSRDMKNFLEGMNQARKTLISLGKDCFEEEAYQRYLARYDAILAEGDAQNASTKGRHAKAEEAKLLRRMRKYKENHLLFLKNFQVPYSNNLSERDLRKCKNRQKMSGGFRKNTGVQMYCSILSVVETAKRRGLNILKTITAVIAGRPAFG